MHFWYSAPVHAPLIDVVRSYNLAAQAGTAVAPYAPHKSRGLLDYPDVRFALLDAFARHDPRSILPYLPSTSCPSPLDYGVVWHLEQALLASKIIPEHLDHTMRTAEISAHFAAQLELLGLYDCAIYVLLHGYSTADMMYVSSTVLFSFKMLILSMFR